MAEENKNQDPEEQKKSSGSDDDFGLPDFDFEALDDDDDDSSSEVAATPTAPKSPSAASNEVPSIDSDDLEGLDLDNLGDIDLSDVGDLGDLNLDDLDLEDLDLDDLDTDLKDFKEVETSSKSDKPVAASAERDEDIFDSPKGVATAKKDDFSDPFEDDGAFFEEESFGEFEMDSPSTSGSTSHSFNIGSTSDLDSDIFGTGDADFDVEIPDDQPAASEPIPFAKRPIESAYHLEDEESEQVSQEEIERSRGKFARVVVLGVLLFTSLGFAFLYFNDTFTGGAAKGEESEKPIAANEETKKTEEVERKEVPPQPSDTQKGDEKVEVNKEEPKKEEPKKQEPKKEELKKQEPKKEEPKKEEPKKEEPKKQTKPASTATNQPKTTPTQPKTTAATPARSVSGEVTVLSAKTGKRHIIVASFLDAQAAQDHARTLAASGAAPVIIPPFDGAPNHRVAIASFATLNDALEKLDGYRQQYDGAWVLRY